MRGSPAGPRRAELSAIDSKKEEKARLHELVWVAGCVTASAAWASGPGALASRGPWGRRCRGTRGPARSREQVWVGEQECTQIGENGLSAPFRGICVHCCAVVDRRGDAGVYTDWRKWPLGPVLGHLCTLLRRQLRRQLRRKLRRLARVASPLVWRCRRAEEAAS